MKAIEDGRMKVVSEKTPLEGDLIACNSFGFGGANCHVLLERNKKQKVYICKLRKSNSFII